MDVVSGELEARLVSINSFPVIPPRPQALDEGSYMFLYEAIDDAGNTERVTVELIVEGKSQCISRPMKLGQELTL